MTRDEALNLVHDWTKNPNLIKHMLAVEAQMRALAKYFGENEDIWGLAGLLHDADYELFKDNPEKHPSKIFEELGKQSIDPQVAAAIKAHAWGWGDGQQNQTKEPESKIEWALYTCDDLSGMIIACALVRPDKRLASVTVDSVLNKWNSKGFARGVNRNAVELCQEKLGVELKDYIDICLKAIQGISKDLGL